MLRSRNLIFHGLLPLKRMLTQPVSYHVTLLQPAAHLFEVRCLVQNPKPSGQRFTLPAWVPGSYMIREFAKHVVQAQALCQGVTVALRKLDKATWQAAPTPAGAPLELVWQVYAWDFSVRAAYLDETGAFFNASSLLPVVEGQAHLACALVLPRPSLPFAQDWSVATTLSPATEASVDAAGFGTYTAPDYAFLLDNPVAMGGLTRAPFTVQDIPHEMVLSGTHRADLTRLTADLQAICSWQHQLFGGVPDLAHYRFLTQVTGDGYGGLEHQACTALLISRESLPFEGMSGTPGAYQRLLGLCSHEYFHLWNVKRLRPASFASLDLAQENYTELLWFFEGFTSYYDDRALVKSGVISAEQYLALLAKTVEHVQHGSGRLKQSVADSSFDAWIKYYRPDENTPNAVVSYYAKGALIALCLDLALRQKRTPSSLDEVMRELWTNYGLTQRGVTEAAIFSVVRTLGGPKIAAWLKAVVHGVAELPLQARLAEIGIEMVWSASIPVPWLGLRTQPDQGLLRVTHVHDEGPAMAAGLSAGDILVAIDGERILPSGLELILARCQAGQTVVVHAFRQSMLQTKPVTLAPARQDKVNLRFQPHISPAMRKKRSDWLDQISNAKRE